MKRHNWIFDPDLTSFGRARGSGQCFACKGCGDYLVLDPGRDMILRPITDRDLAEFDILEDCDEHAVFSLMED